MQTKQHHGDPRDRLKADRPDCNPDGESDFFVPLTWDAAVVGNQDTTNESVHIPNLPELPDLNMMEALCAPLPPTHIEIFPRQCIRADSVPHTVFTVDKNQAGLMYPTRG